MEIIPVVDLKGGRVVHARRGDRARYQPLVSTICHSAEPLQVVSTLLDLFSPRRLYVADLDAIGGLAPQQGVIAAISRLSGNTEIWCDAGFRSAIGTECISGLANIVPVIGSETLDGLDTYRELHQRYPEAVLSLDFRGGEFLGPAALLATPESWCRRVVHLDLGHVGAGEGPAADSATSLHRLAPQRQMYVGGGVRHVGDLHRLASAGISGALIATALHDGSIRPEHRNAIGD